MDWGDPEFVLSIIAMVMFAGIIKTVIRARYNLPLHDHMRGHMGKRGRDEIETLRGENTRLADRVESYEDRIAVLERIVTDSSYRLGHEIESLREGKPTREDGRKSQ